MTDELRFLEMDDGVRIALSLHLPDTPPPWPVVFEARPYRKDDFSDATAIYRRLCDEGGLAVCHVGFGAVWVFSPRGEPLYRIESPDGGLYTTNCAYGGADGRTLHMLESRSGTIFTARVPVAGRAMHSHAGR